MVPYGMTEVRPYIKKPNGGRRPMVKKKFQWTPYSVTCSFESRKVWVSRDSDEDWFRKRTGYWTPFTMATLTSPRRIVGMLLLIDLRRLGQSCRLDVVELGGARKGLALIRPSEKTNDPTPTSICRKGFSG